MAKSTQEGRPRDLSATQVDSLLRQLQDARNDLDRQAGASSGVRSRASAMLGSRPLSGPRSLRSRGARGRPVGAAPASLGTIAGVWWRAALGLLLAVAMTQWPYPHACGGPLAAYLAAVVVVLLAGAWAAHAAWHARAGAAHLAALAIVFAGAALAADQVMPRVGYSPVDVTWRCSR